MLPTRIIIELKPYAYVGSSFDFSLFFDAHWPFALFLVVD